MARTSKILIGEEYLKNRTLRAYPNSLLHKTSDVGWNQPHTRVYFGATPQEEQLILQEALRGKQTGPQGRYNNYRLMENAVTNHFIRRAYSSAFAKVLAHFVERSHWEKSIEQQIVSFQMLNEFLGQDEFQRYGDFLDEHWDELYEKAVQFWFNEYSWTQSVFKEITQNNLLLIRPRLPKVAQKEFEDLTKEQIIEIRKSPVIQQYIANKDARARLKSALAVLNGEQSVSVPPNHIINSFARAFSSTLSKVNPTTGLNLISVQRQFIEALSVGQGYLTSQRAESSADRLFTNDVARYSDYLVANAEKFTVAEMFFACIVWNETKLIARTGTRADVLNFFLEVMDTYKDEEDNLLEFFKMVGEAGAVYDGELPTITHWKNALKNGYLDQIMGADITLTLIAGSDKTVTKLERQRMYRRALKGD